MSQSLPRAAIVSGLDGGLTVIGDLNTYEGHVCLDVQVDAAGTMTSWPASGVAPPVGPRLAVTDGQGGVIIIWHDYSTGAGARWVAGRWDSHGVPSWIANPVVLAADHAASSSEVVASDGAGGAFLAWVDSTNAGDLYIQHLKSDGATSSSDGVLACAAAGTRTITSIASDGVGGALVAWSDGRESATNDLDVYAQRVDANLAALWTSDGVAVGSLPWAQRSPAIAANGAGGALIAWEDDRNDLGQPGSPVPNFDVFAQHLTSTGSVFAGWPATGLAVNTAPGQQQGVRVLADGVGGAYVGWTHGEPGACRARAQRIAPDGSTAVGWPAGGLASGTTPDAGGLVGMTPDHAGGLYVVWIVQDPTWSVRVQHWDGAGARVVGWPSEGISIHTESSAIVFPLVEALTDDSDGALYVLWSVSFGGVTNRSYSRFLQHLGSDGVVPVEISLVLVVARPDFVRLVWRSSLEPVSSAIVQRRREGGWAWTDLATIVPDGEGNLSFEDHDVVPGERYAYRLEYPVSEGSSYSAERIVEVPRALKLALDLPRPSPASGPVTLGFTLTAHVRDARLDVLDVGGRRVWSQSLAGLGAGHHTSVLPRSLRAGIYSIRLTDGRDAVTSELVLLR